ncbi:hypothetical protein ACFSTE_07390 [Aquimarina hainanensis]|uniref:Major facilitator superfamily (MFS) profile domain-containing protein n=1 Tax=Aquimarina hainanensis TaxID=1578017 RepID=A0ABW5N6W7_9FLAO|nr:hypothetical protein [Aquimarina sp. TRL1]QKX05068.1 hypothetical protein HN014_09105 [Aquimarina sp. TRL1]
MIKKEIGIGFIVGLIANSIGVIICTLLFSYLSPNGLSLSETLSASVQNGTIGSLLVLGAILNLIVFFLFIKKNMPYKARGVLLATIIAAICVAISKFI